MSISDLLTELLLFKATTNTFLYLLLFFLITFVGRMSIYFVVCLHLSPYLFHSIPHPLSKPNRVVADVTPLWVLFCLRFLPVQRINFTTKGVSCFDIINVFLKLEFWSLSSLAAWLEKLPQSNFSLVRMRQRCQLIALLLEATERLPVSLVRPLIQQAFNLCIL